MEPLRASETLEAASPAAAPEKPEAEAAALLTAILSPATSPLQQPPPVKAKRSLATSTSGSIDASGCEEYLPADLGEPPPKRPAVGPWSDKEFAQLQNLEKVWSGVGKAKWEAIAKALGTGRTATAVEIKCREGHNAAFSKAQPWTCQEVEHLRELVEKDGPGAWQRKADALGTGRTANGVEKKYRTALSRHIGGEPTEPPPPKPKRAAAGLSSPKRPAGLSSPGPPAVRWDRELKRWRATVERNGQTKELGLFASEQEAAGAFNEEMRRLRSPRAKPAQSHTPRAAKPSSRPKAEGPSAASLELIEEVREFMKVNRVSQVIAGQEARVSQSVISQWLSLRYHGHNDKVRRPFNALSLRMER